MCNLNQIALYVNHLLFNMVMTQFSVSVPEELNSIISKCCSITGRSRNAACVQWILEGAVRELKMLESVNAIPKPYEVAENTSDPSPTSSNGSDTRPKEPEE